MHSIALSTRIITTFCTGRSDGNPVTFYNIQQTNVPKLTSFVHDITAGRRRAVAERLIESTAEFLASVKLYISDDGTADTSMQDRAREHFDAGDHRYGRAAQRAPSRGQGTTVIAARILTAARSFAELAKLGEALVEKADALMRQMKTRIESSVKPGGVMAYSCNPYG